MLGQGAWKLIIIIILLRKKKHNEKNAAASWIGINTEIIESALIDGVADAP